MPHVLAGSNASQPPCSPLAAAEDAKKAESFPANKGKCQSECSPDCGPTSQGESCAAVHSNPASPSSGPRKLVKRSCDDAPTTLKSLSGDSTRLLFDTVKHNILRMAYDRGGLKFGSFTLKSGRKSPFFFNSGCFSDGESMELLARAYAMKIVESGLEFDVLFGPAYKGIPLVACTAMVLARDYSVASPFLYDRKEPKDHGEGGQFVGAVETLAKRKLRPDTSPTADEISSRGSAAESTSDEKTHSSSSNGGDAESNRAAKSEGEAAGPTRVMVLDDVLTAGSALRSSVAKLHAEFSDLRVVALCLLLDRQERVNLESTTYASQQLEAEMETRVLSVLRMRDILEFLDGLVATAASEEKKSELEAARRDLCLYLKTFSGADVEEDRQQDN